MQAHNTSAIGEGTCLRFLRRQIGTIRLVEKTLLLVEFRQSAHAELFVRDYVVYLRDSDWQFEVGVVREMVAQARAEQIKNRVWLSLPPQNEGLVLVFGREGEQLPILIMPA